MAGSNETRVVLLGKSGSGKSSLGNTLLQDSLFKEKSSPTSETAECQAESKDISGVPVKVIDTPGFFDNSTDEETLKAEMIKCIEECAPGIHAFLIVLKVDRYTVQEKEIISKIKQYFSEEALKHAVILFTHGDQLPEEKKIEDFVQESPELKDLVEKCGNRCHVVDNKYWKDQQGGYRCNRFQVEQLLNTIETMKNNQGCYTNNLLQLVGKEKEKFPKKRILIISAGVTVGILLGALCGAIVLDLVLGAVVGAVVGGAVGAVTACSSATVKEAVFKTTKIFFKIGKAKLTVKTIPNIQLKKKKES